MSITFENVKIRITRYDAGLLRNGWYLGNVASGQRAIINGHKTSNVFFRSRNHRNSCEAAIGENCEVLAV